jgi:hypothetical protein
MIATSSAVPKVLTLHVVSEAFEWTEQANRENRSGKQEGDKKLGGHFAQEFHVHG